MADVTFDGNKDLLVYLGQFGKSRWIIVYVWNEVKQKFLFVPSFHDSAPIPLTKKKRNLFSRGSAVDW